MSLDHILLGMLESPASGYDLGREFEQSARHFWFAELSQIYPALRKLEERGWLASREVPSERGPNRRVYRRTDAGTSALHAWLREAPQLHTMRVPYVAKLTFLGELHDDEESRRFFRTLRAELDGRVAALRTIETCHEIEHGRPDALDDAGFHRWASLQAGLAVAQARRDWCDRMLAALDRRAAATSRNETGAA